MTCPIISGYALKIFERNLTYSILFLQYLQAVPHSRRNTDAFNDETFGSIECASEDRVEEERKRRGITSFSNIVHGSYIICNFDEFVDN